TYPVARERVAVGVGPHSPVEVAVGQVLLAVAAEVPVDAAGAQVRARHAVGGAQVGRNDADRARPLLEDRVADDETLELVARGEHLGHRRATLADPAPPEAVLQAVAPVCS